MTEYKGLGIVKTHGGMLYRIRSLKQGSVPKQVEGLYTSLTEAQSAIDKADKGRGRKVKDGKADQTS